MAKILAPPLVVWDAMVALYRRYDKENPNGVTLSTHTQVARILKTTSDVCRKAWHRGWPSTDRKVATLLPIKELVFRDKVLARAKRNGLVNKLMDTRLKMVDQANDDAAESRALEGLAVRQQMMVAGELLANTYQVLRASAAVRESIIKGLQITADDPTTPMSKRLAIMNTISEIAERDSKTLERAQTLERRFMGEVESRQKVETGATVSTSAEAVYDDLAGLFRALNLGSVRGALPPPAAKPVTVDVTSTPSVAVPAVATEVAREGSDVVQGSDVVGVGVVQDPLGLAPEVPVEVPTEKLPE